MVENDIAGRGGQVERREEKKGNRKEEFGEESKNKDRIKD